MKSSEEIDVRLLFLNFIKLVFRRKFVILGIFLLVSGIGYFKYSKLKPYYQHSYIVVVNCKEPDCTTLYEVTMSLTYDLVLEFANNKDVFSNKTGLNSNDLNELLGISFTPSPNNTSFKLDVKSNFGTNPKSIADSIVDYLNNDSYIFERQKLNNKLEMEMFIDVIDQIKSIDSLLVDKNKFLSKTTIDEIYAHRFELMNEKNRLEARNKYPLPFYIANSDSEVLIAVNKTSEIIKYLVIAIALSSIVILILETIVFVKNNK